MQRTLEGLVISYRKAEAGKQSGDFELLVLRDVNEKWSKSAIERIVGDATVDLNKKVRAKVDDQEYMKNGERRSFVKLVAFDPPAVEQLRKTA